MNNYEALEKLNDLRQRGVISEEEFQAEKKKLLEGNAGPSRDGLIWGMAPNTYCILMHLAPLFFWMMGFGLVVSVVLWLANKDQFPIVDQHGKNIMNWLISALIYSMIGGVLTLILIGAFIMGIIILLVVVFAIIGAVKASNGEVWEYPLSFKFIQ